MIGKTISHYKILEKLGAGGMGVVYKAQDTKLDRFVALKFLPPHLSQDEENKKRFIQEAKAASALDHPNICTIYEIDETADGQMFIAMAGYEGETLEHKISKGPLPVDQVLDIAIQISKGLSKAHEKEIVHRDIKPANIFITDDGVVKILDFGLAKLRGQTRLTKEGTTLGTVFYMSPEQVRGEPMDKRTDIWALGVILYEMATGQSPFKGEYDQAVMYSIINEDPEPPTAMRTGLPMELERIISKALAKSTDRRYQNMSEIQVDLDNLKDELRFPASSKSQPVKSRLKPNRLPFIIGGAVFLILIFLTIYLFQPSPTASIDAKSIAVLPFENMNKDEESAYFSNGITEDIITQLSKIADLRVISRTSSMRYKNSEKSLREIGKELKVAYILEGSVRRSRDRIRIVSQLIHAKGDDHVWAETYDRRMADIFDIQSEISQKIASALRTKLSPGEKSMLEKKPTSNLTAYEYYLRGREYYNQYRKQDNEKAIDLFKRALELDAEYALAYAGLGDAYAQRGWLYGFSFDWVDSSIVAGKKALSIDPDLAEGYKALGLAYEFKGWYHKALEANRKAIALNPNYNSAIANMGWVNNLIGNFAEASKWFKESLSLNPTSAMNYHGLGINYRGLEDYDKAMKYYRRALELQPDLVYAYWGISLIYLDQGEYQAARENSQNLLSLFPDDLTGLGLAGQVELFSGNKGKAKQYLERAVELSSTRIDALAGLGFILWEEGQKERASQLFTRCLEIAQTQLQNSNEYWIFPYYLAGVYAVEGNKDESLQWMQKAIDSGFRFYRYASRDPLLENIHSSQQFTKQMEQIRSHLREQRALLKEMEKT